MDGVNGGLKTNSEMCNSSLDIAGIIGDSIVDGPGMRTTVFVQGCPHRCNGCHNPESWEFGTGQKISVMEVFEKIKSNPLCRGVTFSGGEPFCQAAPLYELGKMLKEAGYEIACYTGSTFEQLLHGSEEQKSLLRILDILIDGPFILEQRDLDLRFRGSANQRILDVVQSLREGKAIWCAETRWVGEEQA